MFPGIEKELSKNRFFQEWKKASVFEEMLGPPQILVEEFSEEWLQKLKKIIGDGPMTTRFLANLADYIEKIRILNGYEYIKERLLRLDEQLHPTFVEIEFVWFLLLKTPPERVHLEHTFESPSGKNPEIMVDTDSGPVYFEVTSVESYKQMSLILHYFNILTAFQLSLKILYGLQRKIIVTFFKYPDENIFEHLYWTLNKLASEGIFHFSQETRDYNISMKEGDAVTFEMPLRTVANKIKDKIEEKTTKFKEGDRNYIVIDVSAIVTDIEAQLKEIREYFQYSENRTIWGVLLQSKWWTFRGTEPEYKFQAICQANSCIEGKEPYNTISKLIPG